MFGGSQNEITPEDEMTLYIATVNTPGYLPEDEDLRRFDTAADAWSYLCDERELTEDSFEPEGEEYSETREILACLSESKSSTPTGVSSLVDPVTRTGTVYGPTPGYSGDHDLGLVYTVEVDTSLDPLIDRAIRGYVETMLWANALCFVEDCPDRDGGSDCEHVYENEHLYDLTSFTPEDQASIKTDVRDLIESNVEDFEAYVERRGAESFGHDFALTRNGHGAGFWDRGLGDLGERLSAASKVYGSSDVYVSEEGVTLS